LHESLCPLAGKPFDRIGSGEKPFACSGNASHVKGNRNGSGLIERNTQPAQTIPPHRKRCEVLLLDLDGLDGAAFYGFATGFFQLGRHGFDLNFRDALIAHLKDLRTETLAGAGADTEFRVHTYFHV